MTTVGDRRRGAWPTAGDRVLRTIDEAEEHVIGICFKTGPPTLVGVELEWTVHHADDPTRPIRPDLLRTALGAHAPRTLVPDGEHRPLPHGGVVTVEPGGQVEISTPPHSSIGSLHSSVHADRRHLLHLLNRAGLSLGGTGIDAHRPPRRVLRTPRYDAMADAFAVRGPDGLTMMCSTAGLQVCLDAGQESQVAARWAALHALGPVLLAAFANSGRFAGRDTGWASARMAAWFAMDPGVTRPAGEHPDPALCWARYALSAPVLCIRRDDRPWHAPPGLTFARWVAGEWISATSAGPPTIDDLEYHLTTLFPPVRPRGYLEVRYLDTQRSQDWIVPVAVIAALLSDDAITDAARDLAAPADGRWIEAARHGLADPVLAGCARDVLELACRSLDRTDLTNGERARTVEVLARRLA